jgi:tetratricopeptide (TPR) repeat protein
VEIADMSQDQVMTYGQIRYMPDPAANTEWRTIMGEKSIVRAQQFPDNLETLCGFGVEEKIIWQLLGVPRSYHQLEESKLLLPDETCAMVRGLFAAELIELKEAQEAISIQADDVSNTRALVTNNPVSGVFQIPNLNEKLKRPPDPSQAVPPPGAEIFEAGPGGIRSAAPPPAPLPDLEISALEIEPMPATPTATPAPIAPAAAPVAPAAAVRPAAVSALNSPSIRGADSGPMPVADSGADDGVDLAAITGKHAIPARPAAAAAPSRAMTPSGPLPAVNVAAPVSAPTSPASEPDPEEMAAVIGTIDAILEGKTTGNPYNVLGISDRASDAEVKKAHAQRVRKIHPDALPAWVNDNPTLVGRAGQAFRALNNAWESVDSPEKRKAIEEEKAAEKAAAERAEELSAEAKLKKSDVQVQMAETLLKRNNASEAAVHLQKAVDLNPENAKAHTLLAWCIYLDKSRDLAERTSDARATLAAMVRDHKNADAAYRLGLIFRNDHEESEAQDYFKKAVKLDPNHKLATQEVRLAKNRKIPKKKKEGGFGLFGRKG